MYRGWAQTDYQSRLFAIDQKDEGTWDDRGRDGLTKFTLRIKEQATRLTTLFFNMMMVMKFGQHPVQNSPFVQRHIDPSAVATAGTRAGSPGLEAYQGHSAISAGSPPLCQNGDPLAAASSPGRGRSRKGPNLVSKAEEEVQ
jgi:hypothetical protein